MSLDSAFQPRGIEDIPEKDLRELAKWFKSKSTERRRLLKRYKTGRQKTEALAARKQVRAPVCFPATRLFFLPLYLPPSLVPSSPPLRSVCED